MLKPRLLFVILCTACTLSLRAQTAKAPIAVPFNLKDPGYVTLVIEDKTGQRVRNLVSETWFKAGNNTVWWDGLDDLGRDVEAAGHGIYAIPSKLVAPGDYTVRGLVHQEIKTSYEMAVYAPGNPPWTTNDHLGGWLGNHSAPQAALFIPAAQSPTKQPAVFLGNYITEGPDGLAWVDLDGKKMGGMRWLGGIWTGAPYMARDEAEKADPGISAYTAAVWRTSGKDVQLVLRVNSLPKNADKPIFLYTLRPARSNIEVGTEEIGGFAVYNGTGIVSLPKMNQLVFIGLKDGKLLGTVTANDPHGLAFDHKGRLLVLSGNQLLRFNTIPDPAKPVAPQQVISAQLDAPVGITLDTEGKLYISNGGDSHQVKVFTEEGKFVRAIGHAGVPKAGPYDPLHMNNPAGITIDSRNQLWVAENDFIPKRVSIWTLDGKLVKAFYGPAKYGGGGTIDPVDKNKFYYADEDHGSMEFNIDWQTGESKLTQVLYRKTPGNLVMASRSSGPETAVYYHGKRYFTNCYNSNPTGGSPIAYLFAEHNGIFQPAVAMGRADSWDLLKQPEFKSVLPAGVDLNAKIPNQNAFFIWTDLNADAQVQPAELSFLKAEASGVTVMPDLSFCVAQLNGSAMQFSPVSFTAGGIPVYQIDKGKVLAVGVQAPGSSGGNQVLVAPDGWTVITQGIQPFGRYSLSGAKDGHARWSYPDMWPGLHAGHSAPIPSFPGELVATTRLLGGTFTLKGSDAGPLWAINSNHGMVYIFTADGLFVSTLFEPMRTGKPWNMPVAERGMSLKGISLREENFWPGITATATGEVYLVDGDRSSLVKLDGLQSIERLPLTTVKVTTEDLKKSIAFRVNTEAARQQNAGNGVLKAVIMNTPVIVDGQLDDWKDAAWADIDKRGVKANFNSNSKPFNVTGAVAVSGDRLYAAYRTGDAGLLKNSGELPSAPFKTGGALDLMISVSPGADPKRSAPVAGDLRLLVTLIKGKPHALLYRAVVPGTKEADKIPFSSPWRTVTFDKVEDITAQTAFAQGNNGDFEISVPLSVLNFKPVAGMSVKGDIGILRGDGAQTLSRVYWNNKATTIVSDVPSEAELTPALWGTLEFVSPAH